MKKKYKKYTEMILCIALLVYDAAADAVAGVEVDFVVIVSKSFIYLVLHCSVVSCHWYELRIYRVPLSTIHNYIVLQLQR